MFTIEALKRKLLAHADANARLLWFAGALITATALVMITRPEPVPDFRAYTAGFERKGEFFDFVQPLVERVNQAVLADRRRLEELAAEPEINLLDRWWLEGLAEDYDIDREDVEDDALLRELLRRADTVPVSLALAQAAKESGWGTSRFAREGNNLFGEWCFERGCGIVPSARAESRTHEVQRFASALASVESYIHNLNTHWGYEEFRDARERLRETGQQLTGLALADKIAAYSERRMTYVDEIKRLIRFNDLSERPRLGGEG